MNLVNQLSSTNILPTRAQTNTRIIGEYLNIPIFKYKISFVSKEISNTNNYVEYA